MRHLRKQKSMTEAPGYKKGTLEHWEVSMEGLDWYVKIFVSIRRTMAFN